LANEILIKFSGGIKMSDYDPEWYKSFFGPEYLNIYAHVFGEEESGKQATFVQKVLKLKEGNEVLDLCCGQGRISIPLARNGIRVTGLDFSNDLLSIARSKASNSGVQIKTIESDMRDIPFDCKFDAVISIFTALGYFESDAEDQKVLNAVAKSLKKGGLALFDLLNRDWVVANHMPREWRKNDKEVIYLEERKWDPLEGRSHINFKIIYPDGSVTETGHHIRLYVATEFNSMLERAGLSLERAYGGYDESPFEISGKRMIIIARKD